MLIYGNSLRLKGEVVFLEILFLLILFKGIVVNI